MCLPNPHTLIGVEHFHTDPSGQGHSNQGRRSRPPTRQSELKRVKSMQDALQTDGRQIDWGSREQIPGIARRLSKIISDDARILSESGVPRQLEDSNFSLQSHLQKTALYRKNIADFGSRMLSRHEYGESSFALICSATILISQSTCQANRLATVIRVSCPYSLRSFVH